jgi:hypothetical protein
MLISFYLHTRQVKSFTYDGMYIQIDDPGIKILIFCSSELATIICKHLTQFGYVPCPYNYK